MVARLTLRPEKYEAFSPQMNIVAKTCVDKNAHHSNIFQVKGGYIHNKQSCRIYLNSDSHG